LKRYKARLVSNSRICYDKYVFLVEKTKEEKRSSSSPSPELAELLEFFDEPNG
jgi:hypothetical protein